MLVVFFCNRPWRPLFSHLPGNANAAGCLRLVDLGSGIGIQLHVRSFDTETGKCVREVNLPVLWHRRVMLTAGD